MSDYEAKYNEQVVETNRLREAMRADAPTRQDVNQEASSRYPEQDHSIDCEDDLQESIRSGALRDAFIAGAKWESSTSLKTEIANEMYEAFKSLGALSDLLSIVGSYGDTLADADVLSMLKSWNKAGSARHSTAITGEPVARDHERFKYLSNEPLAIIPPGTVLELSNKTTGELISEREAATPPAERCYKCDDTGDVHRADGEWLGSCDCGATPPAAAPDQGVREALSEMGELIDPIKEALRRMLFEFCDEHYHTCPADDDSGPCDCFAGHLIASSFAALSRPAPDTAGSEWKEISPTSPAEHRKGYLVTRPGNLPIRAYRAPGGDWFMHGASSVPLRGDFEPTHWQDLPEPPPIPRNQRGTP